MSTIHLVFGPQGSGKTTYSRSLAQKRNAIRFSIDEWMIQLFGPDLPEPMSLSWIMERVRRCEAQIWCTAEEIARNGGSVVLDLGFMKAASRADFLVLTEEAGFISRLHYVTAPQKVRRSRVLARNVKKGKTFSFEVTPSMFDYMEKEFEAPNEVELLGATVFRGS